MKFIFCHNRRGCSHKKFLSLLTFWLSHLPLSSKLVFFSYLDLVKPHTSFPNAQGCEGLYVLHSDMPARYTLALTSACNKGKDRSQALSDLRLIACSHVWANLYCTLSKQLLLSSLIQSWLAYCTWHIPTVADAKSQACQGQGPTPCGGIGPCLLLRCTQAHTHILG